MSARHAAIPLALGALAGALWLARGVGFFSPGGAGGVEGETDAGGGPGLLAQLGNYLTNTVNAPTSLSPDGLVMLQGIERFSPTAYPDAAGHSIGFGHFIQAGEEWLLNATISEAQAAELLRGDVGDAERAVTAAVSVPLTQQQYDALVIFAYNVGAGAFKSSTLVKLLNAGDYIGAADQFARWNKSQGQVLPALQLRRAQEAQLFTQGVYA